MSDGLTLAWFSEGEILLLIFSPQLFLCILMKRVDAQGEFRAFEEMRVIEGLDVGKLLLIRRFGLINDWFDALFQLFHDVLVFELTDILILSLDVGVEKETFLI